MATLPTVPTFTDGTHPGTDLNSLGAAVSFLSCADVRPMWHFYRGSTQSIPATTFTAMNYTFVAADSDGVYVPSGAFPQGSATIVTQGYYVTEACAGLLAGGAAIGFAAQFVVTAGAANPNHASGTFLAYGQTGGNAPFTASVDAQLCWGAQCPWVLYPGDNIQAQVFSTGAITSSYAENVSYLKGRFAANFTGYWLRNGVNEASDS